MHEDDDDDDEDAHESIIDIDPCNAFEPMTPGGAFDGGDDPYHTFNNVPGRSINNDF